jgi:CPA2 family monovalent cation:H+ antiporter-2
VPHEPVLIATIAIGLSLAFAGAMVARRLRLPAIVGYLAAGVAIGPFTPGLVADQAIANELAEVGIILLMFGVGIELSIADLLSVRRVAVPGALGWVAIATLLGTGVGVALGWGPIAGAVLGLAISVGSTVVLLRTLLERNELDSPQGRVAVGWLIVEDLLTVLVLVLLPALAPIVLGTAPVPAADATATGPLGMGAAGELLLALGKVVLFAVLMFVVGMRVVPALLAIVARERSRELFTLSVLAVALGIAYVAYAVFGVSFALGAFLAGVVVSESDMSHQAAADALPLRDAFAVLFFVSVGMLVDPGYIVANVGAVIAIAAVIMLAKPLAVGTFVTLAGHPPRVAMSVAAGLSQIGEFSFILATLACHSHCFPRMASSSSSPGRSSRSRSTRCCSGRPRGSARGSARWVRSRDSRTGVPRHRSRCPDGRARSQCATTR